MQSLAKITSHVTELSMPLSSLVRLLQTSALTGELLERSQRPDRLLLRGANRAARALVTTALARRADQSLLVVVPTLFLLMSLLSMRIDAPW